MHIITGILLAGILGRKHGAGGMPMLRTGPVQTEHAMPGRVRFRVPSLVDDTVRAEEVGQRLGRVEGVHRVEASTKTGSLLIEYDESRVKPGLLFAATVKLLGLDEAMQRTPTPLVVREFRAVFDSLNRVVYDRTGGILDFGSAVLILLAALGIGKVMQQGAASLPAGLTLIWWGVRQLLGPGES